METGYRPSQANLPIGRVKDTLFLPPNQSAISNPEGFHPLRTIKSLLFYRPHWETVSRI